MNSFSVLTSLIQVSQTVQPEEEGTIEQKPKIEVLDSPEHEVKTTKKTGEVNGKEAHVVEGKQETKQQTKKGRHKNRKKKQRKDKDTDKPTSDDSNVAEAKQDQKAVPQDEIGITKTNEKSKPEMHCGDTSEKSNNSINKTATGIETITPGPPTQSVSYGMKCTFIFCLCANFRVFFRSTTQTLSAV